MRKDEVIDFLTENVLNERLARIIENDEELKIARVHAIELFNKLLADLSEEQKKIFDCFITANAEEQARTEYLVYKQGLKDMTNLVESLYAKERKGEVEQTIVKRLLDNK